MHEIKSHGRWKSDAVNTYIGPSMESRLSVTKGLFAAQPAQPAVVPAAAAAASRTGLGEAATGTCTTPSVPRPDNAAATAGPLSAVAASYCSPLHGAYANTHKAPAAVTWTLADYNAPTEMDRLRLQAKRKFLGMPALTRAELLVERAHMKSHGEPPQCPPSSTSAAALSLTVTDCADPLAQRDEAASSNTVMQQPQKAGPSKRKREEASESSSSESEDSLQEAMQMEEWNQGYSSEESSSQSESEENTGGPGWPVSHRTRSRSVSASNSPNKAAATAGGTEKK